MVYYTLPPTNTVFYTLVHQVQIRIMYHLYFIILYDMYFFSHNVTFFLGNDISSPCDKGKLGIFKK